MKTLDIVTSAYNEEDCLPELFRRLDEVLSQESEYVYRVIITDNGSLDNTWGVIQEAKKNEFRIHGIKLSRNFSFLLDCKSP